MSLRSLLVLASFCFMGCYPSWWIRDRDQEWEEAMASGSVGRFEYMCEKPETISGFNNSQLTAPGQPEKACNEMKVRHLAQQKARLVKAVGEQDGATLLELCTNMPTRAKLSVEQLGLTQVQQDACVASKQQTANEVAEVTRDAKATGGLQCLVKLDAYFLKVQKSGKWLSDTKTDDGQRAVLAPTADACIGDVEAKKQAGKNVELYKETTSLKLAKSGVLSQAQQERLAAVQRALPGAIAGEYEAKAATQTQEPAAAALTWACAAKMAQIAGEKERQAKDLTEAKAQLAKAAIKEVLTVSLSGDASTNEIISRLRAEGLGAGLQITDSAADIPLALKLSSPKFESDSEKIVLNTEVVEQRGTKIRAEWAKQNADCERMEKRRDESVATCNRNGPKNTQCSMIRLREQDLGNCRKNLGRMKKEEPASAKVQVPYEATRYIGSVSGLLTIKRGDKSEDLPVSVQEDRVGHGFVERAKLSPVNAKPFSAGELQGAYISRARATVYSLLRKIADERAGMYLDSAMMAPTTDAMAADVVRFAVIAKKRPEGKAGSTIDEKLALPAMDGLELLLTSK